MSNYIRLFYGDVITYPCLMHNHGLVNHCWVKEASEDNLQGAHNGLNKMAAISGTKFQNTFQIIEAEWRIYTSVYQPSLVRTMAPSCYLNQCWNIVHWTLRNKLHGNRNRNSYIFIQEYAFKNVCCKIAAILSWPQCVKKSCVCVCFDSNLTEICA